MRKSPFRISLLLAAVAGVGVLALATEATAQFWGWNRGGWSDRGSSGNNWSNERGGWGSRFRDDEGTGFNGDWRRERDRNGGEIEGGVRAPRRNAPRRNTEASAGSSGSSGYYCVRLCDGYYFPLAKAGGFSEAKTLCGGLCPATSTDVYSGRNDAMGEARAQNGKTYASLANAFSYRKALKPECGCTSATAKPMTVDNDPTLRSGDIVVTDAGVRVFQGASRRPYQAKDFVDYRNTRAVVGGMRTQLDAMAKRYYTVRAQATPAKKTPDAKKAQDAEETPARGRRGRR